MRKRLGLFATMLVLMLSLSASAPGVRRVVITSEDEPLPCDPPPTHWCEVRGGTFNYITCRCEFP